MPAYRHLWIAIADGAHARIVVPGERGGTFRTETSFDSAAEHLKSADIGTDRPGRAFESSGATRHAIEPRHDPHEMEKSRFILMVAERLNQESAEGSFDHLVLAAPPHLIHELREALDTPTRAKLVGTLNKDLTKTPDDDLPAHLTEWRQPARPPR
jgi:protein required for attachment to host cells